VTTASEYKLNPSDDPSLAPDQVAVIYSCLGRRLPFPGHTCGPWTQGGKP